MKPLTPRPTMEALENRRLLSASVLDNLSPLIRELAIGQATPQAVPAAVAADPTAALVKSVKAFQSRLNVAAGASASIEGHIRAANLSAELSARLAVTLDAMINAHDLTQLARKSIPVDQLQHTLNRTTALLSRELSDRIASAARTLQQARAGLEKTLAQYQDRPLPSLDVWPVLRLEGGSANNFYANDYALQIDMGGNDTYANNAGGNIIDAHFAPANSSIPSTEKGPARGAQVFGDAFNPNNVTSAALLLDMSGNDTYGVLQTPDADRNVTSDTVIRRIVTEGTGFIGVGILRDLAGDDVYTGKTISQGTGHVGGVGILEDLGGRDSYKAIRNSQGFALVGGVGILHDSGGGNDRFDFYMPRGGVIDDVGTADAIPRFVQGAGNAGGIGIFINDGGDDYYRAPTVAEAGTVNPPLPTSGLPGQGAGINGGVGIFVDGGGYDRYVGGFGRTNNSLVPPSQANPGGFFQDGEGLVYGLV